MRRARGFTLLEMMITVAIVGVLAAIALPNFSYLTRMTRLKSAATEIQLTLLKARSEAVKRNAQVRMEKVGADWKNGWTLKDGATVITTHEALKGVEIYLRVNNADVSSTATGVTYLSSGRTTANPIGFQVSPTTKRSGDPTDATMVRCVAATASGAPFVNKAACS